MLIMLQAACFSKMGPISINDCYLSHGEVIDPECECPIEAKSSLAVST